MKPSIESCFRGQARDAMRSFFNELPQVPRERWPALLHGMGYNFEFYDALFPLMVANVQLSFDAGDYSPRYRSVQAMLLPFCSEFGIETGRPLLRTHRELYADFYRRATGRELPERYPRGDENPWLNASRKWSRRMAQNVACADLDPLGRAEFNLAYCAAVEHLSTFEFDYMRQAWASMGVQAPYLDAHCDVESDHDSWATRALFTLARENSPIVDIALRTHEEDIAGYYLELAEILPVAASTRRGALDR